MDLITDIFDIIETLYPGINISLVEDKYPDLWVHRLGYRINLVVTSTTDQYQFSEVVVYKSGYYYSGGCYHNCANEEQCLQYIKSVINIFHDNMRNKFMNTPGVFINLPNKIFIPLKRKSHELTL